MHGNPVSMQWCLSCVPMCCANVRKSHYRCDMNCMPTHRKVSAEIMIMGVSMQEIFAQYLNTWPCQPRVSWVVIQRCICAQ